MNSHIEKEGDGPLLSADNPVKQSMQFWPGVQEPYELIVESYGIKNPRLTYGNIRDVVDLRYGIGYVLERVIGYHDFQAEIVRGQNGKHLGSIHTEWIPSSDERHLVGLENSTLGFSTCLKKVGLSTS